MNNPKFNSSFTVDEAVRAGTPRVKQYGENRKCLGFVSKCDTVLSIYNDTNFCGACKKKMAIAELDRLAHPKRGPYWQKRVVIVRRLQPVRPRPLTSSLY